MTKTLLFASIIKYFSNCKTQQAKLVTIFKTKKAIMVLVRPGNDPTNICKFVKTYFKDNTKAHEQEYLLTSPLITMMQNKINIVVIAAIF